MMHPAADIRTLLQPGRRVHLAGIGGVSMCALAEVLQGMGLVVQGSDMTDSDTVRHLRSVGIEVAIGHSAENLKSCDAVIRTAAIHDGNPEIAGAIARGIPVYERAQAWGGIMRGYRNALCVSGTHGKTTTTSMAAHIFMAAQKDPTVMIGGTLPLLHAGYRVGQGDTIILESCEYCNSFLNFFPTVAVILNVHADHLDFFKDLADIEHSFHRFAELVPAGTGKVVVNWDDEGARAAVEGLDSSHVHLQRQRPRHRLLCRQRGVLRRVRRVRHHHPGGSATPMRRCTFPVSTMYPTRWRPPPPPICWGWTAAPWRRGLRPSPARDGGSSTRASITGRRCTTTTPTIPTSWRPCSTRCSPCPTSG